MTSPHLSDAVPTWCTPAEAAVILHRHIETIRKQLKAGTLPGVMLGGRWYVDLEAISAKFPSRRAS